MDKRGNGGKVVPGENNGDERGHGGALLTLSSEGALRRIHSRNDPSGPRRLQQVPSGAPRPQWRLGLLSSFPGRLGNFREPGLSFSTPPQETPFSLRVPIYVVFHEEQPEELQLCSEMSLKEHQDTEGGALGEQS